MLIHLRCNNTQQLYTTLRRALHATIASMGEVRFRNSSISRMRKSATQFWNWIPVSKLACNFAISNLHRAISKLCKFENCAEHIHMYVLRKVQIRALHGQSPYCTRALPHTTNVVHVYVQSSACVCWFLYVGWRMVHGETFEKWTKETFRSGKKVRSKVSLLLN